MNDEHTDVLIINKTCETQMSDDEQAGIDPERKSSEQQKKERDERALRRSQGIPASSPVAAQVVKKLTDSEKILITRDIEGIIINCARRGLKKDRDDGGVYYSLTCCCKHSRREDLSFMRLGPSRRVIASTLGVKL